MRDRAARPIALLLLLLLFAGCTRAIEVGSEPRPTYRLSVVNELPVPMIVSYSEPRGDALLGTVPAGRAEHFVIAGTAAAGVVITARSADGTLTRGPYTVQLTAGQVQTVRLQ
jgi:hypothetical protein